MRNQEAVGDQIIANDQQKVHIDMKAFKNYSFTTIYGLLPLLSNGQRNGNIKLERSLRQETVAILLRNEEFYTGLFYYNYHVYQNVRFSSPN